MIQRKGYFRSCKSPPTGFPVFSHPNNQEHHPQFEKRFQLPFRNRTSDQQIFLEAPASKAPVLIAVAKRHAVLLIMISK